MRPEQLFGAVAAELLWFAVVLASGGVTGLYVNFRIFASGSHLDGDHHESQNTEFLEKSELTRQLAGRSHRPSRFNPRGNPHVY
jgi:hypothetical protein